MKTFLVAGGDMRSVSLARTLSENDMVSTIGIDGKFFENSDIISINKVSELPEKADCLVLPLPVSADGVTLNCPLCGNCPTIRELSAGIKSGGIVFGGKISPEIHRYFEEQGFAVCDFLDREELAVLNAVPTAEGAVQIAISETNETIYGQQILITGMGRIAKVLIKILTAMGAKVTAAARKYSDLAWAEIYGCTPLNISEIDGELYKFGIIFNTVPSLIFDEERLLSLKSDCLLIDLASKPGGVDFHAAEHSCVKAIHALSLPGKTAPVTAGRIIASAIYNILEERSEHS